MQRSTKDTVDRTVPVAKEDLRKFCRTLLSLPHDTSNYTIRDLQSCVASLIIIPVCKKKKKN